MTISGIATAAMSNGHKLAKFQGGVSNIARSRTRGKTTEAAIEASETYRHIKTVTTHTAKANKEQIV